MNSKRAIPVELCTMVMVKKGGLVLVENRTDPDWPGIVFPGGHVEAVEPITLGAAREVKEETGVDVKDMRFVGFQEWWHGEQGRYLVFYYEAEYAGGDLLSSEEGETAWVPLKDLPAMPLAEGFDQILKVYLNSEINELYHVAETGESRYY